jgi:hypothetical protein
MQEVLKRNMKGIFFYEVTRHEIGSFLKTVTTSIDTGLKKIGSKEKK